MNRRQKKKKAKQYTERFIREILPEIKKNSKGEVTLVYTFKYGYAVPEREAL